MFKMFKDLKIQKETDNNYKRTALEAAIHFLNQF